MTWLDPGAVMALFSIDLSLPSFSIFLSYLLSEYFYHMLMAELRK